MAQSGDGREGRPSSVPRLRMPLPHPSLPPPAPHPTHSAASVEEVAASLSELNLMSPRDMSGKLFTIGPPHLPLPLTRLSDWLPTAPPLGPRA